MLKDGDVLFRTGDPGNGMYLVRKGELEVFIEQGGKVVSLAKVGAGGMVGEMALFDQQPRSASVRAAGPVEITIITNDDFAGLMKQIPKWFVTLMTSLSTRLRQTNDRLKVAEAGGPSRNKKSTVRVLNLLNLIWQKDPKREAKELEISIAEFVKIASESFGEDPGLVQSILTCLSSAKIITMQKAKPSDIIMCASRASLLKLATVFADQQKPLKLSAEYFEFVSMLCSMASESPYDPAPVQLEAILTKGRTAGRDTAKWSNMLELVVAQSDGIIVQGKGIKASLKGAKKDFVKLSTLTAHIYEFYRADLI
jgi:CRP-like cAMP-binding protein